jgi:hypothetical protein
MVNKARASAFGAGSVSVSKFSPTVPIDTPKVSSIAYVGDDTATNTAGGDTITVNGSSFKSGCFVYVDRSQASVVSFISSTQITFVAPAKSAGTYTLYVYNPDGGTAIYLPGISYSGTPTWINAAGSIGTAYETVELSSNVSVLSATSNSTVKYRLYSGSLPTNASLNTNTGVISGVTNSVAGITTYTFVIEAYDLENQGTLRTFSITLNPDIVIWNSPSNEASYSTNISVPFSLSLSASSITGDRNITYTSSTLPAGLSITGNTISGNASVLGNTTSYITATSATTSKSSVRTLLFSVVPNIISSVEYLVVAGGAGGGDGSFYYTAGGGGAGGLLAGTLPVSEGTTYAITIGGGGPRATNGSNSTFSSITTIGGGAGVNAFGGSAGGSGGGGGCWFQDSYASGPGGAGTVGPPRQGYSGGASGTLGEGRTAGGGGGAGGPGGTGTTRTVPANGGIGAQSSITGVSTYYAGGGAAGAGGYDTVPFSPLPYPTGGAGGGGNGGPTNIDGTTNTGGGGSGGTGDQYYARNGGVGGSGIVILAFNAFYNSLTISAGLTYILDTSSRPGYKVYKFTAGTGTVSW